jgi:hypothetical protein
MTPLFNMPGKKYLLLKALHASENSIRNGLFVNICLG